MLLLPLLLLPLLGDAGFLLFLREAINQFVLFTFRGEKVKTYPRLQGGLVPLAQLPQVVILLLLQVGVLLNLGLVEPVDDGVFSLGDKYFLDLEGFNVMGYVWCGYDSGCVY
jgi:hypothetical protein